MSKVNASAMTGILQCSTRISLGVCLMPQDGEKGKLDLAVGLSQSGGSDMCDYSIHNRFSATRTCVS